MRPLVLVLASILLSSPAWASPPGTQLDCSDWVWLEPGHTCETLFSEPCNDAPWCENGAARTVALNNGDLLGLRIDNLGNFFCGSGPNVRNRVTMVRRDPVTQTETDLGYIEPRCGAFDTADYVSLGEPGGGRTQPLTFDPQNGVVYMHLVAHCDPGPGGVCSYTDFDFNINLVLKISGFATTFDILQTFQPPASSSLRFRVPYMPSGLEAADAFDTFYGSLTSAGDWSQAQALQCGYPASPPATGDLMTVDTSSIPTPAPGQGVYILTAVTFGGERRMGRSSSGGVLSGRDVSTLPPCS